MAFFNPLGAISSAASGAVKGYTEDLPKLYEMMGVAALGKAFQAQPGPIDQMNRGPQPPMPGQPSAPADPTFSPMAQGPTPAGPPLGGAQMPTPMPAAVNAPPPAMAPQQAPGGGPPPSPGATIPGQPATVQIGPDGAPQFDLQTLTARIKAANPNLPPEAMWAAINKATPLLSMTGKQELMAIRNDQREQALRIQEGFLDAKRRNQDPGQGGEAAKGLMSPQAIEGAAERYVKTGQMPPNLGRGTQGRADMAAIQNRAAELAQERQIAPGDLPKKWQEQKAEQVAIQRFMSGPQGNTMRSLNVVVDHLATMRDLATELKNGNLQAFNRIANEFAAQTGNPAPTNFDAAKQIVGAEIIKALGVAGAGTMSERKEAADSFSRAKSPDQLMGAIKTAQKLLAGQLGGMRKQFKTATGLPESKFDEMMNDETKQFLNPQHAAPAPAASALPDGWSVKAVGK